jgi:hypothetical protein
MSKLPASTLDESLSLQLQLLNGVDETTATEWVLFDREGETEITVEALDQLQNAAERLKDRCSRLSVLLLRIAEAQPASPAATLDLLQQTIASGQNSVYAVQATVQEVKRDWNLL